MAEIIISSPKNTSDGSINLPDGTYIREIIQKETAGNKVLGGIKYGSDLGLDDIISSFNMDPFQKERLVMDGFKSYPVIYFSAANDWNGAEVDITLVLGDLV